MSDVILMKRQTLENLLEVMKRAKDFHFHAHKMKVAEGIHRNVFGSPLLEDLDLTVQVLDQTLNPQPNEHETLEG